MEPSTPPPAPDNKKPINWPIAINLGLLLLNFLLTRSLSNVAISIVVLAVINGIAAVMLSLFGKMRWVTAFILSALLVLLIGLGLCALALSNLHINH
ncbi:hypothetical protein [Hymenobacter negativus]|uniref:Phage holin family protein n=1 Tax=Hymenobacter negativus TaxID=2795026 RepID=A0ABS3QMX0_9BACT|nr:hypothetical protein [Hymenobacter negativus]MBO2012619.1 hypothetical protein [Hymenobacter negativus]